MSPLAATRYRVNTRRPPPPVTRKCKYMRSLHTLIARMVFQALDYRRRRTIRRRRRRRQTVGYTPSCRHHRECQPSSRDMS